MPRYAGQSARARVEVGGRGLGRRGAESGFCLAHADAPRPLLSHARPPRFERASFRVVRKQLFFLRLVYSSNDASLHHGRYFDFTMEAEQGGGDQQHPLCASNNKSKNETARVGVFAAVECSVFAGVSRGIVTAGYCADHLAECVVPLDSWSWRSGAHVCFELPCGACAAAHVSTPPATCQTAAAPVAVCAAVRVCGCQRSTVGTSVAGTCARGSATVSGHVRPARL